jgi:muramidase (phage lysozyme)
MARGSLRHHHESLSMYTNRAAFLDMIGVSEGTSTSPLTQNHGYDVIVSGPGGGEIFTDYSDHPFVHRAPKVVNSAGLRSTASGKYQIMVHDWPHYKALLGLTDFSPVAQDAVALQLIRERSALPLIDGGDLAEAIARCANLWASFAGAGYGQHEQSVGFLVKAFTNAGGQLHADTQVAALSSWGNEART